jgi:MFS family permease
MEVEARWLTRPLLLLLLTAFLVFCGFASLLSVAPLYAVEGGSGSSGAGLVTGALTLASVVAQSRMPGVLAWLGYRRTLTVAIGLISLPTLLLVVTPALWLVVGVSAVRGLGFGAAFVVGSALMAELVPASRRGQATGLYGVAVGIPGAALLPLGVWLAYEIGFAPVLTGAALVPLLALAAVPGIRVDADAAEPPAPAGSHSAAGNPAGSGPAGRRAGVLGGLLDGGLARPFLVMLVVAAASGVVVTFVPLVVSGDAARLVPAALLAQAVTSTLARWAAGAIGDRVGAGRLLTPGLLAAAVGVAAPVRAEDPLVLLGGMVLFGAGFGVLQNVTLVMMFSRVPRQGYGLVSSQWNLAFDGGIGLGSAAFGIVIERAGYDPAFALAGALLAACVAVAALDRRATAAQQGAPA